MFPIDRRRIKRNVNALGTRKKSQSGLTVAELADSYKMSVWNLTDTLNDKDAYTMLNWVLHVDRWIDNLGKDVHTKYERGDIVFVEWGAMNFGFEPSYEHPGVVVANAFNSILVAPCSRQTFGKGYKGVFDLLKVDAVGLTDDSGISASAVRWISKNRIINHAGSVSNRKVLDQVDDFIVNQIHLYQIDQAYHENELYDLNKHKNILEKELADVKAKLEDAEALGLKHLHKLTLVTTELRSFMTSVEELLLNRAPDLMDAYREAAGTVSTEMP